MKTPFLIPLGTLSLVDQALLDEYDVREIDTDRPIMSQMMHMPTDNGVQINTPESWPEELRNGFVSMCHQAYMSLCLSKITQGNFAHLWNWNILSNCARFLKAIPICRAPAIEGKTRALVIGNGPSLSELRSVPENVAVFCAWHAAKKVIAKGIHIDYICHCDAEPFDASEDIAGYHDFAWDSRFIATPNVHPSFTELTHIRKLYGYFGQDQLLNSFFAEKHQCVEHEAIHTTVASLMVSSALYLGFKEIGLIGVDNAWLDESQPYQGTPNWKKVTNSHGVELCTTDQFGIAAHGLYTRKVFRPETNYYQLTKNALDIKDYQYMALDDFLNG